MNLGQAVAVCLYQLSSLSFTSDSPPPTVPPPVTTDPPGASETPRTGLRSRGGAPSGALDALADLIEQTMIAADYSPRVMQAANRHDLRLMLRRLHLGPTDLRRALGFFRRILWRLNSNAEKDRLPR